MKIIVSSGESNSGKTTTLKLLASELLKKGKLIVDYPKNHQCSCIDNEKLAKCGGDIKNYNGDITAVIEVDGKIVGISSFGDYVACIESKMKIFLGIPCDVIITAAHPNDDTILYVRSLKGSGVTYCELLKEKGKKDDSDIVAKIISLL